MRAFSLAIMLFALAMSGPLHAGESPVPARHLALTRNLDFHGTDLAAIFDTTESTCERTCLNDSACHAFTFNTRSNACFPKSGIIRSKVYEGAISGRVIETDPALLAAVPQRVAELGFLARQDFAAARAQALRLAHDYVTNEWSAAQLLAAARVQRASGRLLAALRLTGAALNLTNAADQWVELARLALSVKVRGFSERRKMRETALSASLNGYLRAETKPLRASALVVMADALEATGRGRVMIPALRLAQTMQPRADTAAALERALGLYGFRITANRVESDSAAPRICAEFSDPLVAAGVDYAPFVQLPAPDLTIEAQGREICIDGVRHGSRYRIGFRAGLPAANGERLARPVVLTLYVRDRSPSVRFPGRAYILPRGEGATLPVITVNTNTLDLKLSHVSDRNLLRAMQENLLGRPVGRYEQGKLNGSIGTRVWTGQGKVGDELNRDMTTRLPLGNVIADLPPGLYALQANVPGAAHGDTTAATQWFLISNIGLATISGTDGLSVFARALGSAEPMAGVQVQLISEANTVLGSLTTDARGFARFAPGLTRGTAGAAPALVTARTTGAPRGDDFAFLSLRGPEFDLSDRGVTGRPAAEPIDVFLSTERGAYRAGETVHVTALARDSKAAAIRGLPLTAIVTRPDGVEYTRLTAPDAGAGGHAFAVALAASAPRGTWTLSLYADVKAPPLASTKFLVEDFLPERIDFALALPDGTLSPGGSTALSIRARYLFGAPGAALPVSGDVKVEAAGGLADWPGYRFGRAGEALTPELALLPKGVRTDAAGTALVPVDLPLVEGADRPLQAVVTVRLHEGSGRPVERRLTRALAPLAPMIGLKPLFDGVVAEGTEAAFDAIALGAGKGATPVPVAMKVKWTLDRIETRYQWYQLYGRWKWEPVTRRTRVSSGTAQLSGDGPVPLSIPVNWGRYELKLERLDGAYVSAVTRFWAGWYAPADTTATPDTLAVSLDRPAYRAGDTATLRLVARAAGKALVTVLSDRVIAMRAMAVTRGENIIRLPVTDEWGAGVYVTATVIRPLDVAAGHNPARALGLVYARVDPGTRQLSAAFEGAMEATPRAPLDVALRVGGVRPGETAYATIAAVDLGILNLTGFNSPDPSAHYFGQRRLGVGLRDVYGRLIDGMNGALGKLRSGGGVPPGMRTLTPPPRGKLLAFFSGPVAVGSDGLARARFNLPAFNGTVRLMAIVWSASGIGQAQADVLVRDPVVVTASRPRFLAPGDRSRMLLELTHVSGPTGRVGVDVSASGPIALGAVAPSVTLAAAGKATLSVPLSAQAVGVAEIRVTITTPDGRRLVQLLPIGVRDNAPPIARTSRFSLADGKSFTLDGNVFAGLVAGSGSATLAAGPIAQLDAPGLLQALDRYPYGCTEQITSKALPLIYFDQVARTMHLDTREGLRARVAQAIVEVLSNQSASGAFGLWRPDSGDFWLDAYVSDFLGRARTQGYAVPALAFRSALDNLRNQVNYAADFEHGGEALAYALYVLAREGAASVGDLRYYADVKAGAFSTPLALAQLGAALASYGDQTRADALFARAVRKLGAEAKGREPQAWRADYGSRLRDTAAVLTLAVEAGSKAVNRMRLAAAISPAHISRARSTQEEVWTLMAAHALIGEATGPRGLLVDGAPANGPLVRVLSGTTRGGKTVTVENISGQARMLTLTTFGVPSQPEPAGGKGYRIERSYFTPAGTPVKVQSVALGTRLVTVLKITPFGKGGARLMVSDPLPAGFEIDNPHLLRAGDIRALGWLKTAPRVRNTEFRDDRFLAAVDDRTGKPFQLAYIVRATSPGNFSHPAASVEDMYRPEVRARSAAGRVTVTP